MPRLRRKTDTTPTLNSVIHADVLEGLDQLPAGLFHCTMTSPPYWRLRSYPGVKPTTWADGQTVCLGAEADPDSFVRHLVQVFDGVRRVLRDDGVLFVNLGETYANQGGKGKQGMNGQRADRTFTAVREASQSPPSGLKSGDRCMIPQRFVLAMVDAGWWFRDEIQWHKKSPMPSSQSGWRWVQCRVRDPEWEASRYIGKGEDQSAQSASERLNMNVASARASGVDHERGAVSVGWLDCPGCPKCIPNGGYVLRKGRFRTTAAHEPIFMFAKSARYFCDDRACAEKALMTCTSRTAGIKSGAGGDRNDAGLDRAAHPESRNPRSVWKSYGDGEVLDWLREHHPEIVAEYFTDAPRSVWSLSNEPVKEKHFAAYPSKLVRKCIDMATSAHGCCPACGSPYAPIVESERVPTRPALNPKEWKHDGLDRSQSSPNRDPQRHIQVTRAAGYRATCTCEAGEPVPCRVLDPFGGTGTTARVAYQTGRDWCLIEASADYLPIIDKNIHRPLPTKKGKPVKKQTVNPKQKALF